MDIKDILDSLGLDLTNPEAKRGALEAIEAILDSRTPPPNFGGGAGVAGGGGGAEDVEIDPDLLQPSRKHQAPGSNDDVEIEDEDNILDQVQYNDPEDDSSNNSDSSSNSSSSGADSDTTDSTDDSGDTDGSNDTTDTASDDDSIGDGTSKDAEKSDDEQTPTDAETDDSTSDETSADADGDSTEDDSDVDDNSEAADGTESSTDTDELSDDTGELNGDESDDAAASDGYDDNELSDDDDIEDFDEDDLLDDNLRDTFDDETAKTKQEARKIKRERTLQAAKVALDKAKTKKASASLVRELEKAIEALESLTEAVSKSLKDISDDEFNLLINRVFDAIEALGDSDLTFTSDEDRALQAQEIKDDIASTRTQQELSAEDIAQIRAETQAVQAREKEANKYKARARSSFKGFQDFLSSLYRAIALQVHVEETRDDSWGAISRRNMGAGVLQPGKKINELSNKKIPVIDFYFDQSGSWDESDIAVGQKAVQQLVEMEENGQIKINIFYFSDDVYTDAGDARASGGTSGWNEIVKNVISTQATNVIIMTDADMENWWNGPKALSYIVPGYVWYLWRDGINAPRLPRDLKGRGGTQQFSFSTADA